MKLKQMGECFKKKKKQMGEKRLFIERLLEVFYRVFFFKKKYRVIFSSYDPIFRLGHDTPIKPNI